MVSTRTQDKKSFGGTQDGTQDQSGNDWVHCHNVFNAALAFGRYKQYGWGRKMGAEVLNIYTAEEWALRDRPIRLAE